MRQKHDAILPYRHVQELERKANTDTDHLTGPQLAWLRLVLRQAEFASIGKERAIQVPDPIDLRR